MLQFLQNVLKAGPWILNSFVAWSKLNSLLKHSDLFIQNYFWCQVPSYLVQKLFKYSLPEHSELFFPKLFLSLGSDLFWQAGCKQFPIKLCPKLYSSPNFKKKILQTFFLPALPQDRYPLHWSISHEHRLQHTAHQMKHWTL